MKKKIRNITILLLIAMIAITAVPNDTTMVYAAKTTKTQEEAKKKATASALKAAKKSAKSTSLTAAKKKAKAAARKAKKTVTKSAKATKSVTKSATIGTVTATVKIKVRATTKVKMTKKYKVKTKKTTYKTLNTKVTYKTSGGSGNDNGNDNTHTHNYTTPIYKMTYYPETTHPEVENRWIVQCNTCGSQWTCGTEAYLAAGLPLSQGTPDIYNHPVWYYYQGGESISPNAQKYTNLVLHSQAAGTDDGIYENCFGANWVVWNQYVETGETYTIPAYSVRDTSVITGYKCACGAEKTN